MRHRPHHLQRGVFDPLGPPAAARPPHWRIIAGLESPDEGRVILGGTDVTDWEPNKRGVNTVFQSYALFPHMNVENNIAYGLKLRKVPKRGDQKAGEEMLELVQLPGFGERMPSQLSGGQRQGGYRPGNCQQAFESFCWTSPLAPWISSSGGRCRWSSNAAAKAGHHLCVHHPRPGGSPQHERPDRHHEPG